VYSRYIRGLQGGTEIVSRYSEGKKEGFMTEPSIRSKKRLRRRLECEAYAKDARFWKNKIKSADRKFYDRPTDGQAVKTVLKNTTKFEENYKKLHDTPV
jgi:hypothetical protein